MVEFHDIVVCVKAHQSVPGCALHRPKEQQEVLWYMILYIWFERGSVGGELDQHDDKQLRSAAPFL